MKNFDPEKVQCSNCNKAQLWYDLGELNPDDELENLKITQELNKKRIPYYSSIYVIGSRPLENE